MLLVISEVALALLLSIGAGLMVRSFLSVQSISPGFDPEHVLSMRITLPVSKYSAEHQRVSFFQEFLEQVKTLPGVQAAGAVNDLPLTGPGSSTSFSIKGRPREGQNPLTEYRIITPDHFAQ